MHLIIKKMISMQDLKIVYRNFLKMVLWDGSRYIFNCFYHRIKAFWITIKLNSEGPRDANEQKDWPAVKHCSKRNTAVWPTIQLRLALRFYATWCFQRVGGVLLSLHNSTFKLSASINSANKCFSQRRRS